MVALLEIKNLTKKFGGLTALEQLDLDVEQGEILGVIGPNGAGKTTLFNIITGFLQPTRGRVIFQNENINGLKPHTRAKKGIIRTFQLTDLFGDFTVLDNMHIGFHLQSQIGLVKAKISRNPECLKEEEIERKSIEILNLVGMDHLKDKPAKDLSHGYHKSLAVAIALAANPQLLLLDEPVTSLNPERVAAMMGLIRKMRERGVTIVLIEHNMKTIFGVCDKIVVLDHGIKIAEGLPDEIRTNKNVIAAYLGNKADITKS